MNTDSANLEQIARQHDTHADFDRVLATYGARIISPQVRGRRTLECGCSTGVMTAHLVESASQLDIVEGAAAYAQRVQERFAGRVRVFRSLFEDFHPEQPYESVVFAHVLHHLANPGEALLRIQAWLAPGGRVHVTVPNINAFHRQLGVAMGLVQEVEAPSARNTLFQQPGRYDQRRLTELVRASGFEVEECYGFLFKPFPHDVMNSLNLSERLLDGLFEMGKKYPELACQIYLRARRP